MTGGDKRSRLDRLKESGLITTGARLKENISRNEFRLFPGQEREEQNEAGSFYLREMNIPLQERHGQISLGSLLDCRGEHLALLSLDNSLTGSRPSDALFFDIETTGLSGGTGTWAFLIGVGWREGDSFRLRQYFLRRPAEERAMLLHLGRTLREFDTMVSFNGKSFDLPLIQTRQILTGTHLDSGPGPSFHIDLLHCSRRLWKERLPSCSLQSLEKAILSYHREDDIPGAEIPYVYFDYLRKGQTTRLKQVFEHNRWDILSMVALMGLLADVEGETFHRSAHPADYYSLGRLMWRAGRKDEAARCYQHALRTEDGTLREKALQSLGFLYKQMKMWDRSARCWEELSLPGGIDLLPYVELAKIHEHHTGHLDDALEATRRALDTALRRQSMGGDSEAVRELNHRLKRIERKIGRKRQPR